jgi:hypothetical protein
MLQHFYSLVDLTSRAVPNQLNLYSPNLILLLANCMCLPACRSSAAPNGHLCAVYFIKETELGGFHLLPAKQLPQLLLIGQPVKEEGPQI